MMKILLIQPSLHSMATLSNIINKETIRDFDNSKFSFPLGILSIGSLLEKHDYQVKILDLDKEFYPFLHNDAGNHDIEYYFDKYLVDFTSRFNPDVVGISGNFNCNKSFITVCCEKLKKFKKDLPIVLGGHYPTNCYRDILENDSNVDYIIIGEGEEVMLQFLEAIRENDFAFIEKHPNIVVKKNVLSDSPDSKFSALVQDLDKLPLINYELLDCVEEYIAKSRNVRILFKREVSTRAVVMMTSRGCPFSCTYCASSNVHGKKIRAFSVDRVINEIDQLVEKYDINALIFEDDLFTFNRKRTVELSKGIYERFGDRFFIEFSNGIAVAGLNEECIYWMAKSGMKQIHLAIESGNQYVQDKIIKKRLALNKVKPVVELLKKYDVNIRAFFIMGFPGESLDMMRDTKNFAKELKVDWAIFSFASPVVGSELYETARMNNQLISANSDATTYFEAQLKTKEWTHKEVEDIQEEANYEVNFLGNYNLIEGKYEKCVRIFSDICADYPKHLIAHYCLWKTQIGKGDLSSSNKTKKNIFDILKSDEGSKAILDKYNLSHVEPFVDFLE
jgi:anaerobic magnesium-protoporphyrin IX monomethyl ester cyclase